MPHENKKMYMSPKSTGTIPKVKQRNNNNSGGGADRRSNLVSNNLGNEFEATQTNQTNRGNRNQNRNFQFFHMMDVNQENGLQNGGYSSNGTLTSNESNTIPRRNSSGLSKCDNVAKYPDKKQIESKLSQIQEYLQVATSMKANMKRTDEQIQSISIKSPNNLSDDEPLDDEQLDVIISDLTDSALKLQTILDELEGSESKQQFSDGLEHLDPEQVRQNHNELERKVCVATRDLQVLKEQENYLLQLQLNAENKLREARLAQDRLAKSSQPRNTTSESEWCNDSDTLSLSGASSGRNIDLRELEERIKSFNVEDPKVPLPEQFQGQIDHLQNHILQMRESNDNRTQLIQMLDSRDAQLQAQHNSLQGKLQELQNKKQQVDQLVVQLQTMNEESEEDEMGCHVKKIVNMKEQLTKLKDMLNLVENTENSIEGHEEANDGINSEIEENVNRLIAKTDNLMQQNRVPHVENVENQTARNYPSNERRVKEKQVNKKSMSANEKERMKLQAEMRAKSKELEELMCKHKAANSNLNHDNHSEKNSEMGACGNSHFENAAGNAWYPMDSNIFNTNGEQQSSESDDCPEEEEPNDFSEMNSSGDLNTAAVQPMPVFSYPTTNYVRKRSQEPASPRIEMPHDSFGNLSSRSPARSVRSVRSATPAFPPRENATSRSQIQKQLELIKTVCDSMIDSTNEESQTQSVPVRVRNNLTPSPIYSEPRHFSPRPNLPAASSTNALNVVNYPEPQLNMQMPPNISPNDTTAYNNWLTTNSLQTQAFILNTLNQCCQMLWHQQKELSSLRNTVTVMQDRFGNVGNVYHDDNSHTHTPLCMQSNPCIYQPNLANIPNNYMPNNYRHPMAPKTNQMTPQHQPNLNSGSMPNLNGCHPSTSNATNMEHAAFCNNMMPNNNQPQNLVGDHQLNTNHILHNQNVPTPIWNGTALNNQVAPGNRANNYWDNFRSYSRQNLFSTKSNDGSHHGIQNVFNERSNQTTERRSVNQDLVSSSSSTGLTSLLAKSNSIHNETASAVASVENSPRRISIPKRRVVSTSGAASLPSQSSERTSDRSRLDKPTNEGAFALPRVDSDYSIHTILDPCDVSANMNSNRNSRNDWPTESTTISNPPKSKLVDDLRENVYKEVASLISANEERPHFLIQLFQDLQLVSSDPLRRNVLQSVQELITTSLASSAASAVNSTRQLQNEEPPRQKEKYSITEESPADYGLLSMQRETSATTSDGNISDITADVQMELQRASLMWQEPFHDPPMSSYLNMRHEDDTFMVISEEPPKFMLPFADAEEEIPRLQILVQNGDLAEADQSCAAEEDDEGAVGGLLNILERSSSSNAGQIHIEQELNLETEDESEQGLDQVPTRLSNPPSIGCSPKSQ